MFYFYSCLSTIGLSEGAQRYKYKYKARQAQIQMLSKNAQTGHSTGQRQFMFSSHTQYFVPGSLSICRGQRVQPFPSYGIVGGGQFFRLPSDFSIFFSFDQPFNVFHLPGPHVSNVFQTRGSDGVGHVHRRLDGVLVGVKCPFLFPKGGGLWENHVTWSQ